MTKISQSQFAKPSAVKTKKSPDRTVNPKKTKSAVSKTPKFTSPVISLKVKPVVRKASKNIPDGNSSAKEPKIVTRTNNKKVVKPHKTSVKKVATKKVTAKKSVQISTNTAEVRNFIVGIGASAGGLEALSDLIGNLPDDLGVPYIVVQHLSPTHRSMMVPLLARETSMLVKDAEDGEIPLPNVIYVTPANWNIVLKGGVMSVMSHYKQG